MDFFSELTDTLLRQWPEKGVSAAQITGALKTALDADSLVNALAEVFRVSPSEAAEVLSHAGFGGEMARRALQMSDERTEEDRKPLCSSDRLLDPFPELFTFHAVPDPMREVPLPAGLHDTLFSLSKQIAAAAENDPFAELYRVGVGDYYRSFMEKSAPKMAEELNRLFPNARPRYVVTTGIGANEQFCHYAAAINNADPARRSEWIVIHSPRQLSRLPQDATVENTLFLEFSRSSMTEETLKLHEYTLPECRRIVFSNGGGLKALADRDGNLLLPLPDGVSGRYGRNKTPILLAPMLACGMDTAAYWKRTEEAIQAFDLSDPDSLPHVLARMLLAFQRAKGTNLIYLGCNDDTLSCLADELIQFWNEGVNKNGNDYLMSRFFGLPRDSHMNLEGVLGNACTKLGLFLLRDDLSGEVEHPLVRQEIRAIRDSHAALRLGDEEAALSLANYRRFTEVMPTVLLRVRGALSMDHSAVLGQLFSDVTFVYSRMTGIDPGSNPEVKFVRERSAALLERFSAGLAAGKTPDAVFEEQMNG